MSILPALCKENPPVTSGSPNKGKCTILIEIMQKVIPGGTRHFSSGLSYNYSDVIMSTLASPITSFTIVYSTVYSGKGERDQSSASLAFVREIHWWPVNSPHKGPVTRKCFHLMTSSFDSYASLDFKEFTHVCYSGWSTYITLFVQHYTEY